jgi:hypothetical protein
MDPIPGAFVQPLPAPLSAAVIALLVSGAAMAQVQVRLHGPDAPLTAGQQAALIPEVTGTAQDATCSWAVLVDGEQRCGLPLSGCAVSGVTA